MAKSKHTRQGGNFVLDCSVTVAWFFEDEVCPYAEAVEDALSGAIAHVPAVWPLEVANALVVGERRKRTTEARATQFLTLLTSLPVTIDSETVNRAWHETLRMARAHQLSVYDAAYLELAMRRAFPLATLDDRLKSAAKALGLGQYRP